MEIRKIGDHTEKTRGGYLEEGWKKVEQALARAATGSYCKNRKRW